MNLVDSFLARKRLQSLIRIHTDSFNFSINQGFFFIIIFLKNLMNKLKNKKKKIQFKIFGLYVSTPNFYLNRKRIKKIPRQCRELKIGYNGDFLLGISSVFEKKDTKGFIFKIGEIPVMIRSIKCNLFNQKKKQMIEMDEEEIEMGGYFIIKGVEKILRLLIVPKKNIPITVSRINNVQRGDLCTSLSCSLRSVDRLQTSRTIHFHYLTTGSIHVRIIVKKKEFFFPIIILIKSLTEISDQKIFETLIKNNPEDKFLIHRIMIMMKEAHQLCNLKETTKILDFLGKILKVALSENLRDNIQISEFFLYRYIFVHLGNNRKSKMNLLFFMIMKLLFTQKGICIEDNPDSIDSQEFLLPGHLLLLYFKEKIENSSEYCFSFHEYNILDCDKSVNSLQIDKKKIYQKLIGKVFGKIHYGIFQTISTGSLIINLDQELIQTTGLSISVERINFGRFLSYFRSLHRGKFFLELKTTSYRKLWPQSWGFICPVHTPDGLLCGILNHISFSVVFSQCNPFKSEILVKYFRRFMQKLFFLKPKKSTIPMIIDGKIIGFSSKFSIKNMIDQLRCEKVSNIGLIPICCEISFVSRFHSKSFFPNLIISTEDARLLRPVKWELKKKKKNIFYFQKEHKDFSKNFSEIELLGSMEQNFLNIDNIDYRIDFIEKILTGSHREIECSSIFSIIAGATPFSEMNQSPRNIYQCQMSKQSIGVPFYTFWRRDDSKNYFLLTPQIPICRNKIIQDGLYLDSFPNSFNAIVAVLSYTGFDMEDGMVINKASIQRGFSMINMFNCIDLSTTENFHRKNNLTKNFKEILFNRNFLKVGHLLKKGDPLTSCHIVENTDEKIKTFFCYKGNEKAQIEQIKISSKKVEKTIGQNNLIKIRNRRRPFVGDKFASRHGQKGVFSFDYSCENLPFSDLGVTPEIIFNPHGLPSRMTMGVILESIIGKTGVLHGIFQDSTSFRFGQNRPAVYHYGEKLRKSGFQFFGNEILYSGYTGEPFNVDIFIGIVNYQRLRHMVLDKYQMSNCGPRNSLTRQPIKGRKSGGSIRFGEMERDALLGQGCTFLLHDRIQTSSDLHTVKIGMKSGIFINNKAQIFKTLTKKHKNIEYHKKIILPYVLKFLAAELSSINIKLLLFCN